MHPLGAKLREASAGAMLPRIESPKCSLLCFHYSVHTHGAGTQAELTSCCLLFQGKEKGMLLRQSRAPSLWALGKSLPFFVLPFPGCKLDITLSQ